MNAQACAECGRGSFVLTPDGFCPRCDLLVTAQAQQGVDQLGSYLANHAAFAAWLADDYTRMSA